MPEVQLSWGGRAARVELARAAAEHAGMPLWAAGSKWMLAELVGDDAEEVSDPHRR